MDDSNYDQNKQPQETNQTSDDTNATPSIDSVSSPSQTPPQPAPTVISSSPPQPVTMQNPHRKRTPWIILLVVILIAAAGFAGYEIENSRAKKAEDRQQAQILDLQQQLKSLQKKTSTSSASSSNAYAGWKSYTLKNEKLTFLYPPTWTAGPWPAATPSPTQDVVELSSPSGMKCNIEDGISNKAGSSSLVSGSPIKLTYMNKPAYLVFNNPTPAGSTTPDTSKVEGAILLTNPSDVTSRPLGKTATGTSTAPDANNGKYIAFACSTTPITLEQALANQDYKDAKLIVESMHY